MTEHHQYDRTTRPLPLDPFPDADGRTEVHAEEVDATLTTLVEDVDGAPSGVATSRGHFTVRRWSNHAAERAAREHTQEENHGRPDDAA